MHDAPDGSLRDVQLARKRSLTLAVLDASPNLSHGALTQLRVAIVAASDWAERRRMADDAVSVTVNGTTPRPAFFRLSDVDAAPQPFLKWASLSLSSHLEILA
jgi:hypothetical protein